MGIELSYNCCKVKSRMAVSDRWLSVAMIVVESIERRVTNTA